MSQITSYVDASASYTGDASTGDAAASDAPADATAPDAPPAARPPTPPLPPPAARPGLKVDRPKWTALMRLVHLTRSTCHLSSFMV